MERLSSAHKNSSFLRHKEEEIYPAKSKKQEKISTQMPKDKTNLDSFDLTRETKDLLIDMQDKFESIMTKYPQFEQYLQVGDNSISMSKERLALMHLSKSRHLLDDSHSKQKVRRDEEFSCFYREVNELLQRSENLLSQRHKQIQSKNTHSYFHLAKN